MSAKNAGNPAGSAPSEAAAKAMAACEAKLRGNKFDILWNGKPSFDVYFKFLGDGTVESNQSMFNKQPWKALSGKQFALMRKNGSDVIWQFSDKAGREAFRTDKKLVGMRLKETK